MMGKINCCKGCTPPKRNPWCHSDCPEYIEAKAAYNAKKVEEDRKRDIQYGLTAQAMKGVNRAEKARKRSKGM